MILAAEEYKTISIALLPMFRDQLEEKAAIGEVDFQDVASDRATTVEGLFFNVFGRRRANIPLQVPQPDWSIRQLVGSINEALELMAEENPLLLKADYCGRFHFDGSDEQEDLEV